MPCVVWFCAERAAALAGPDRDEARKAKAHEEPIRGPSSQQQPWEASQLGV